MQTLSGIFVTGPLTTMREQLHEAPVLHFTGLDDTGAHDELNDAGLRRILGAGGDDVLSARAMASIDIWLEDWWEEPLMDPRDEDAGAEEDALQMHSLGYGLAEEDLQGEAVW